MDGPNNSDFPGPSATPQPPAPTQAVDWMTEAERYLKDTLATGTATEKAIARTALRLLSTPSPVAPTQAEPVAPEPSKRHTASPARREAMDKLEAMARKAGLSFHDGVKGNSWWSVWPGELQRFAELVRADERERCAKVREGVRCGGARPSPHCVGNGGQKLRRRHQKQRPAWGGGRVMDDNESFYDEAIAPDVASAWAAFAARQKPLPADMLKVLHDNYWELIDPDDSPASEAPAQAGGCQASVDEWCEYVAGMVGAYLKWPIDDVRVKAVAGIIQRRMWAAPPAGRTLTDDEIDALDTFSLHWMAPRGKESVRQFARAILAASSTTASAQEGGE